MKDYFKGATNASCLNFATSKLMNR